MGFQRALLLAVITAASCGGDDPVVPADAPVDSPPDAPASPTCLNRDPTLDQRCIALFVGGGAPFGFRCDDGAPRPNGPEYPPSCFLFEATFHPDGSLNSPGKMCCTTEGPAQ
jgi:hypothetical protein